MRREAALTFQYLRRAPSPAAAPYPADLRTWASDRTAWLWRPLGRCGRAVRAVSVWHTLQLLRRVGAPVAARSAAQTRREASREEKIKTNFVFSSDFIFSFFRGCYGQGVARCVAPGSSGAVVFDSVFIFSSFQRFFLLRGGQDERGIHYAK